MQTKDIVIILGGIAIAGVAVVMIYPKIKSYRSMKNMPPVMPSPIKSSRLGAIEVTDKTNVVKAIKEKYGAGKFSTTNDGAFIYTLNDGSGYYTTNSETAVKVQQEYKALGTKIAKGIASILPNKSAA